MKISQNIQTEKQQILKFIFLIQTVDIQALVFKKCLNIRVYIRSRVENAKVFTDIHLVSVRANLIYRAPAIIQRCIGARKKRGWQEWRGGERRTSSRPFFLGSIPGIDINPGGL